MTSATTSSTGPGASPRLALAAVVFVLAFLGAIAVQKLLVLGPVAGVLVALLPAAAFFFVLLEELKMVRRLDELQQRIQLEALAIGFPLAMIFFMFLGFLQRGGFLPHEDLRSLWGVLPLCYFIGLAFARRRYL